MVTIVKPIYTQELIWGVEGAKTLPPTAKVKGGWVQEMMPAEYENWIQNRQDQALAYLYQFGLAEWDSLTEYIAGKSLVQSDGKIYRALQTHTNITPTNTAYWVNIFTGLGYVAISSANGAAQIPSGTTAQRPVAAAPTGTVNLRYNSTTKRWEFFADNAWTELIDRAQGITGTGSVVFANSPTFTGAPKSTTPAKGDNSKNIATTEFVALAVQSAAEAGVGMLKPVSNTQSATVATVQDIALPVTDGATSYLMLGLDTSGVAGDLWDIEIYNSTPSAANLLYYARLITGKFDDKIPMILSTPNPIVRIVNQRSDGVAVQTSVKVTLLPCA